MSHTAPDASSGSSRGPDGLWRVGTLTYTVGGLIVLFLLLVGGDFAWSMRERAVGPLFQLLLKRFHANDLLVSLLTGSIPALITLIVFPIVSVWSDRHRSRFGRRIPFLFIPTPFIVATMVGLAYAPELGAALHRVLPMGMTLNGSILTVFGVLWVFFEVFAFVTNAVFYGLVNDTVPREFIGRFFAVFRMASLGAGIYFNYSLFAFGERQPAAVFLGIAAVYLVGFTIMCLFVKEGKYPDPETPSHENPAQAVAGYFKDVTSHRFYVWAFVTLGLAGVMAVPVNLFSLFTAKSFGMDTGVYGKYLAATYIISFALSFPLGWLTDKFHPMRTAFVTMVLYGLAMALGFVFVHDAFTFGVFLLLHGVLSGSFFTTSLALYPALFPKSRFTQFYSAYMILQNVLILAISPVLGRLLDWTGHRYTLTFLAGALVVVPTFLSWLVLFRAFAARGGYRNFKAPEVDGDHHAKS